MSVIDLSGSIIAGPTNVTDTTFPSMVSNVALHTTPTPRSFQVCTGALTRNLNSPSAYVALEGVGSAATVTHADFLYLRTSTTIRVKITQVDGISTLVSEQDVSGLLVIEKPSGGTITVLEVKGSGTIEYLAAGQS